MRLTPRPIRRERRGRRGGRGGRLVPPLFLAALVVDNDSGMLAMLGLLVMMHLALCSLLASPKDSYVASQLQSTQVVVISFAAQWQSLMVQSFRRTIDILQLLYTVIDVPVVQVEAGSEAGFHGPNCSFDHGHFHSC